MHGGQPHGTVVGVNELYCMNFQKLATYAFLSRVMSIDQVVGGTTLDAEYGI